MLVAFVLLQHHTSTKGAIVISTLTKVNDATIAEIVEEMEVRNTREVFLLFGLGSQTDHLIKLRMSQLGVFVLAADPSSITAEDVAALEPAGIAVKGIVLSGGPASVHSAEDGVSFDREIFELGIPVLGICLGFQLWAQHVGCRVEKATTPEFGVNHQLELNTAQKVGFQLFAHVAYTSTVVQSHNDHVIKIPRMQVLGSTENTRVAAARVKHLWGVQFHPEMSHTEYGMQIFENFIFRICGAQDRFPVEAVAQAKVQQVREQIGDGKVVLAFSGGTDSCTVAEILGAAVDHQPGRILAVYIKGIDRHDDEERARQFAASRPWLELTVYDATIDYLQALAGKVTMRDKRVAMRGVYKPILVDWAKLIGADYIAQGTLYTDISESGHGQQSGSRKARIKLHHNVGLDFEEAGLTEITPLDDQVKDSGRAIGTHLGIPSEVVDSQPFPGPGLVVRISGEVTEDKLKIARHADGIFVAMLRKHGLYETVWQSGVVSTNEIVTVTKGDDAGDELAVVLFAVTSLEGFTADFARLPWEFIDAVSRRITNEVPGVGRVTYNVTSKPPGTIEWG